MDGALAETAKAEGNKQQQKKAPKPKVPTELCTSCYHHIPCTKFAKHQLYCIHFGYRKPGHLVRDTPVLPILNKLAENPEEQLTVADVFLQWPATVDAVMDACHAPRLPELDPAFAQKVPQTIARVAQLGSLRETDKKLKHWTQEAIMILLIEEWLVKARAKHGENSSVCIVEVGAYGGELSHMLQQFVGPTQMVLIDTCQPDNCVDDCYAGSGRFSRLTCPVQEVTAGQIKSAAGDATIVIVMAKHLCGDAADSMLEQADWSTYTGQQLFREKGIGQSEFDFVKNHVAWKNVANRDTKGRFFDRLHHLGRLFEHLFDVARDQYMQRGGFDTRSFYFCHEDVTMRNIMLIATKSNAAKAVESELGTAGAKVQTANAVCSPNGYGLALGIGLAAIIVGAVACIKYKK